jgi:hypothetical protein
MSAFGGKADFFGLAAQTACPAHDEFTVPRCVTGHKLDIQKYKGPVTRQIATLFEQAA